MALKIRDIGIYDPDTDELLFIVKGAKSYKDAIRRYEKESGKKIGQSGISARNIHGRL